MHRRHRIPFSDVARRVTGISTPVFGISWTPGEDKRDTVRQLVAFLEDRRVLYADYDAEYGPWVERSLLEMRGELTRILQICPDDEHLAEPIRAMRAACRRFLDEAGFPGAPRRSIHPYQPGWLVALGELRATFGLHLARLCAAYGVDVEPELGSILPPSEEENE